MGEGKDGVPYVTISREELLDHIGSGHIGRLEDRVVELERELDEAQHLLGMRTGEVMELRRLLATGPNGEGRDAWDAYFGALDDAGWSTHLVEMRPGYRPEPDDMHRERYIVDEETGERVGMLAAGAHWFSTREDAEAWLAEHPSGHLLRPVRVVILRFPDEMQLWDEVE